VTHPSQLPLGTRLPAGLGVSTVIPEGDFETYSEAGYVWVSEVSDGVLHATDNTTGATLATRRLKPRPAHMGKWQGPPGAPKGGKGLEVVGVAVYAEHPSTEVLSFTYNLKDGRGPQVWLPGMPNPQALFDHIARGGLFGAWNSAFEWWIWNLVCTRRYGWPPLPLTQTRCDMGKARAHALPGRLELAGDVLNLQVRKDKGGAAMLDLFSKPRTPTIKDARRRITLAERPEDAQKLIAYNVTDTVTEAEASALVPDLEGEELEFWLADQLINRRGVHVDRESLEACVVIVQECLVAFDGEIHALTGGAVERTSQLERLKGWLASHGVYMGDGPGTMDDEAIEAKLATLPPHPPGKYFAPRRALELRQLAGSASVKKVFAMRNQLASDNRLHDLFNYHGARTGRPTGEGPQPTNLPKAGPDVCQCGACGKYFGKAHTAACPWCGFPLPPGLKVLEWNADATEDALAVIRTRSMHAVQWYFGDAMLTVSGCLRGLFCAAPGHDLIASDFTAIEAVVTACLAGEDWRVDVFAKGEVSIYLESASRAFGVPVAEMLEYAKVNGKHHPLRDKGKRMELGLGFGGWITALRSPYIRMEGTDEELKDAILKWRAASPAVVEFWGGQERRDGRYRYPELFGLEGMAIKAMMEPGCWQEVRRLDGTLCNVAFVYDGMSKLYARLPSGRLLTYWYPRLEESNREWGGRWQLSYEGYNTNPKNGPIGWNTQYIYGGKWCENIVQAVARDIQRRAILNLHRAGYPVVLHVYDEDVTEVREGWGSIEGHEACMMAIPEWATYKGNPWPIKAAGGWRGKRYRKG
jgi:DNA polymerase